MPSSAELYARHARLNRIRRRVVAGASLTFVALTGAIAFQFTTGHDPALASAAKAQAQAPGAPADPGAGVDLGPSVDPGAGSSGQVAPLTTGQS